MADVEVVADVHGDVVRVRTNLGTLDACHHDAVLRALTRHLGYEPMDKGGPLPRGAEWDPRYPELGPLIERAQRDWQRWGAVLVERLTAMLREGRGLPMDHVTEQSVTELLLRHRVGLILELTGHVVDRYPGAPRVPRESAGAVGVVEVAYRSGLLRDPLEPPDLPTAPPAVADVVRRALGVELTEPEQAGLEYVRRRAAVYMRRPIDRAVAEVERVLTDAEYAVVRPAIAAGVEHRWAPARLARELRDAVEGDALNNDMLRVARTELAFAHGHAAATRLADRARDVGDPDPLVYKLVHPRACAHCRRIWGAPGAPVTYRLSEVWRRDADGGNVGLPASQWGPVSGPVHPNCTEGPLQYYHPEIHDRVQAAVAKHARLLEA